MTTRTIGLLATLAVALAAAVAVATSSSETAPKSSEPSPAPRETTTPSRPKPLQTRWTAKESAPADSEQPAPPRPRRDLVPRITVDRSTLGVSSGSSDAQAPRRAGGPSTAELEASVAEAQDRFRDGDFAEARAAADALLANRLDEIGPQRATLLRIAAVSACALGDASGAEAYIREADRNLRATVALACAEQGVQISSSRKREPKQRPGKPRQDLPRDKTPSR